MAVGFKKPLRKITELTLKNWNILGDNAAVRLRNQIRDKKFFKSKSYSPEYATRKTSGKAAPKGVPQSSTSGTPDLTLTGKFLNSIRRISANKLSVTIGPSQLFNDIKIGNAQNGRDITDSKLNDIIANKMVKDIEKILNKNINKSKEKIVINI